MTKKTKKRNKTILVNLAAALAVLLVLGGGAIAYHAAASRFLESEYVRIEGIINKKNDEIAGVAKTETLFYQSFIAASRRTRRAGAGIDLFAVEKDHRPIARAMEGLALNARTVRGSALPMDRYRIIALFQAAGLALIGLLRWIALKALLRVR